MAERTAADRQPIPLSEARVLIANDDGIQALGLRVLEKVVRRLAREIWVVAPETEQSAASHSLTMRRPLSIRPAGLRRYAVDGTPTDCVLLAVHQIMVDAPPDYVLSGINRGGNMGEDAIYSGTVAAAREGALLGIPSLALSQVYRDPAAVRWPTAARWTDHVLRTLLATPAVGWPRDVLINVNFPDVAAEAVSGVALTRQGHRKIGGAITVGADPRGAPFYWIGPGRDEDSERPGTDLEAVSRGSVAITPLGLDLTHEASLQALREVLR